MEFRILGPLEVEQDGRLLQLGGPRQRALLSLFLLHANEVVPRDRLIDELWGDEPPETARTALQVHVSQLRKVLGSDLIVTRAPGYVLRIEPDGLDLERFELLLQKGRSALEDGRAKEAAETLRMALSLWRGPPLEELEDAPFARRESLRLEELQLGALEERIQADLELGRHRDAIRELSRLVAQHPLRERLRGHLMLALYRSGRQADALEAYREGRRLLSEELGLEPGEELRRLERAILEQDATLASVEKPPPKAPEREVPTGTVTFLFTDIEGSTRLVQRLGDAYGELLVAHNRLIRSVLSEHGGQEIDRQGDAFFFAFRRARDAVAGAVAAQRAMLDEEWPENAEVRVRIGISMGEPGVAEGAYHGLDVVRAARISGAAFGGQILVSSATRDLVGRAIPDVLFRDLGQHRLPELEHPERIFQVLAPGLPENFPPLTTAEVARVLEIGGREEELAAAAEAALGAEERRVRLFRGSRVMAALGVLVLVATAANLLTRGDGATALAAPGSVAVVDAKTARVVDTIEVGSGPVAIVFGHDSIWAANSEDDTVSRIDPETREVEATIGVASPVDLAASADAIWVASGIAGTVSRIDPESNDVVATIDLRSLDPFEPRTVHGVAAGAGGVWAAVSGPELVRIDPAQDRVVRSIDIGIDQAAVAVGHGALWVVTGGQLLRIEPTTGAVTDQLSVGSAGAFTSDVVAADDSVLVLVGDIWIVDPETARLSRTLSVGESGVAPQPALTEFVTAVTDPPGPGLWAATSEGALVRFDSGIAGQPSRIELGPQATGVAIASGAVWVAIGEQEY